MTSKQITFCGKYEVAPLNPLQENDAGSVGSWRPSAMGSLETSLSVGTKVSFHSWSLGQQLSRIVTQGPEPVGPRPMQGSSDETSLLQSFLLGWQRPCQAYSTVWWVPSPTPASALSSPRCDSDLASWRARTQPGALPDNKGTGREGRDANESLHLTTFIPWTVSTTFLCGKMNNRYLDVCYLFDRFLSFSFVWHGNFRTGIPKIQH